MTTAKTVMTSGWNNDANGSALSLKGIFPAHPLNLRTTGNAISVVARAVPDAEDSSYDF
jgi:hypothetical protein